MGAPVGMKAASCLGFLRYVFQIASGVAVCRNASRGVSLRCSFSGGEMRHMLSPQGILRVPCLRRNACSSSRILVTTS
jgi:hypothetical protein